MSPDFKTTKDGLLVYTYGTVDYNKAVGSIRETGIEAHWSALKEELPLKTVLKGVPVGVVTEEVKEDLLARSIRAQTVTRMRRGKDNPLDMIPVMTDRSEKERKIFDVEKLSGFRIRVEGKKNH